MFSSKSRCCYNRRSVRCGAIWVLFIGIMVGGISVGQCGTTQLNFSGKITQAGCTVKGPSDVEVQMGDWFASEFSGIGSTTAKQVIPVILDCTSGAKIVAIIQANTDDPQNGIINVSSSGSGTAAKGVGVKLIDASNNPLVLNSPFVVTINARDGTYTPGWYAQYIQTGSVIEAGPANALAVLTLSYQ